MTGDSMALGAKPGEWVRRRTADANTFEGAPKKSETRSAPQSCAGPNVAVMTSPLSVAGALHHARPMPLVWYQRRRSAPGAISGEV